ncbi:Aste57867_21037 [Aphanomyces stellatus]|uniref:Aste57867_21037 protein n=1 Tax=Aphanomyces stellatus TaxID=120398 RepID=A0A485LGK9_9STRA|nr:hypothetical protein As57867_020969 [Aphanomyces stellatus]VFT97712.1 Aste57867_21037 [Aphanomyces stellatus]
MAAEGCATHGENKENAHAVSRRRTRRSRVDCELESTPRKSKRVLIDMALDDDPLMLPSGKSVESPPRRKTSPRDVVSASFSLDDGEDDDEDGPKSLRPAVDADKRPTRHVSSLVSRYALHLHPDSKMSSAERMALQRAGLSDVIFVDGLRRFWAVNRSDFSALGPSFDTQFMGHRHCVVRHHEGRLFIERCSKGSVRVNDVKLEMHLPKALHRGDVVTVVNRSTVTLKYLVSHSFVRLPKMRRHRADKNRTIAVCAAAPLIGMDRQGNHHPIPDIPVERHFDVIQHHAAPRAIHVKSRVATWMDLRSLLTWGCRVLHFMGQGSDSTVYLEDHLGMVHPVSYATLLQMLDVGGPTLQLVVLSYTPARPLANVFLAHGVPHVVAVHDSACLTTFYAALTSGLDVQTSVDRANEGVTNGSSSMSSLSQPSAALTLYTAPAVSGPNAPFRWVKGAKAACSSSRHLTPSFRRHAALPPLSTHFTHRQADVFRICEYLASKARLVTVAGRAGVGKTEVGIAVAHRVDQRHHILGVGSRMVFSFVSTLIQAAPMDGTCLWSFVRKRTHTHTTRLHKWPTLIVLDGCDPWLHQDGFRALLHDWFKTSPTLQVLLTARGGVTTTHKIAHVTEEVYILDDAVASSQASTIEASSQVAEKEPKLHARFQTLAIEC